MRKSMYPETTVKGNQTYGLTEPKTDAIPDPIWSGDYAVPALGTRVNVGMNGFGPGEVVAYFIENTYLGIEVRPDVRPEWHIKQNGPDRPNCLVFGAETNAIVRITCEQELRLRDLLSYCPLPVGDGDDALVALGLAVKDGEWILPAPTLEKRLLKTGTGIIPPPLNRHRFALIDD